MAKLIGDKPNQVPTNADLGTLAYQDKDNVNIGGGVVDGVTATNVDINSGTIDNAVIGGSTPAAGTFTALQANTSLNVDGTVTADGLTVDASSAVVRSLTGTASPTPTTFYIATTSSGSDWSSANPWGRLAFYSGDGSGSGPKSHVVLDATASNVIGASSSFSISTTSESSNTLTKRLNITSGGDISFYEDTGTTPKLFWDASAESLGIGTTSPQADLVISDNGVQGLEITAWEGGDTVRLMGYNRSTSSRVPVTIDASQVIFQANTTTERMRIDSDGTLLVGKTAVESTTAGTYIGNGQISSVRAGTPVVLNRLTSDGGIIDFRKDGTTVGTISVTDAATAYNTSSDYRLKENVVDMTGAVDRVKALPVRRFNFIADPDKTVDGFLAHEAQEIVPEAVTGEKDAVDKDGKPEYQGIDQSKLVPLLTGAIKELIAKVETLEAEIQTLKGA